MRANTDPAQPIWSGEATISSDSSGASLYAIGPMTRGALWESIAVADISTQAQAIARRVMMDRAKTSSFAAR